MAGFVVEAVAEGENFAGPLKLVDLGECEEVKSRVAGRARVAWARWRDSHQLNLIETSDRLLLIEGQPDRPPAADEELSVGLTGAAGVFAASSSSTLAPVARCGFVRLSIRWARARFTC